MTAEVSDWHEEDGFQPKGPGAQAAYRQLRAAMFRLYEAQSTRGRLDDYVFMRPLSDSLFFKSCIMPKDSTYCEVATNADGTLAVWLYRPVARFLATLAEQQELLAEQIERGQYDVLDLAAADIVPGLDHPDYNPYHWQRHELTADQAESRAYFVDMATEELRKVRRGQ